MKKKEILKSLLKLSEAFKEDREAVNALELLKMKAEGFRGEEVTSSLSGLLALPSEMEGFSNAYAVFSDGACRGNPGPGSWGSLIQDVRSDIIFRASGVDTLTTNNKMELEGVIRGLNGLIEKWIEEGISDRESPVLVYSDSKYVIDGIKSWVEGWKKRGWKKADNKTPENLSQWMELDRLKSCFNTIQFYWVKGHAGHPQNEECDKMANQALDEAGF